MEHGFQLLATVDEKQYFLSFFLNEPVQPRMGPGHNGPIAWPIRSSDRTGSRFKQSNRPVRCLITLPIIQNSILSAAVLAQSQRQKSQFLNTLFHVTIINIPSSCSNHQQHSIRALLVGADSKDQPIGSMNDVASMFGVVLRYDIERENIVTLVVTKNVNLNHPLCAISEESTKENIERHLTALSNKCARGDAVLVYFSGHSDQFLTDVFFECTNGWISGAYLREWGTRVSAICRVSVLMDTCFAGKFYSNYFQPPFVSRFLGSLNGLFGQKVEPPKSLEEDTDTATGLFFLGSSSATEKSVAVQNVSTKRGVFSQAISRAISQKKRNVSNLVLFQEVYGRVQRQARQEVTRICHPKMEELPFFHL